MVQIVKPIIIKYYTSCCHVLPIRSESSPQHLPLQNFDHSSTNHHHSVFCLTTGSKPPLERFLHIVRSNASSFKWEYPLLSLRSSSSFLRLLLHLLVTSISPFIFPSITCFRRQFLRQMWPIQLASTDNELKTRKKETRNVRRLYILTFTSFTIMIRTHMSKISLNAQVKIDEAYISANKVSTDAISAVVYYSTIYWERAEWYFLMLFNDAISC